MTALVAFRRKPSVVACELDGGSVLLDLETSRYFGLNAVGVAVWDMLASPHTTHQLCTGILNQFDVPEGRCRDDVERLMEQMLERQLVERAAAAPENA